MTLTLFDYYVLHNKHLVRAVWSDIKPPHQYEESYSNDGGRTWGRLFLANLTRSK